MIIEVLRIYEEVEFITSWKVKCKSLIHTDGTIYLPLGFESELESNGIFYEIADIEIIDDIIDEIIE